MPYEESDPRIEELPYPHRWLLRRRAAGLSQKDVAARLGIHTTVLSAYENGRRLPRDSRAFDRRHKGAIADLSKDQLVLDDLSPAAADSLARIIDALSRRLGVPIHLRERRISEDRTRYEVEVGKHTKNG